MKILQRASAPKVLQKHSISPMSLCGNKQQIPMFPRNEKSAHVLLWKKCYMRSNVTSARKQQSLHCKHKKKMTSVIQQNNAIYYVS